MRKQNRQSKQSKISGISLIELLVSILIVAIGLLGTIALQLTGVRLNSENTARSQAISAAYDLIESIRSQKHIILSQDEVLAAYRTNRVVTGIDCKLTSVDQNKECTDQQIAEKNKTKFLCHFANFQNHTACNDLAQENQLFGSIFQEADLRRLQYAANSLVVHKIGNHMLRVDLSIIWFNDAGQVGQLEIQKSDQNIQVMTSGFHDEAYSQYRISALI